MPYTIPSFPAIRQRMLRDAATVARIDCLQSFARLACERRYVRRDNLAISESYFELLKEKGFFNQ